MLKTLTPMIAALSIGAAAFAQSPAPAAPLQVQLLAPQLLAFSGSSANFESLVNGLTQGTPVTLTTVSPDAGVQIVTFLPATALTPADAARSLEAARQSLISRGIALPNAQQLAIALMGGVLPTPAGSTQVTGVVSGNAGATPIQVRNELAPPPASGTGGPFNLTPANLQALRTELTQGTRAMSLFEANQALQLASTLLAQQGIVDPTPEQLRVAVQGLVQGQVRNTSDSRLFGTSDSRVTGTSNTPPGAAPARGIVGVPALNRPAPISGAGRR